MVTQKVAEVVGATSSEGCSSSSNVTLYRRYRPKHDAIIRGQKSLLQLLLLRV